MIAAVVVCAAVLGAGVFFIARPALAGDFAPAPGGAEPPAGPQTGESALPGNPPGEPPGEAPPEGAVPPAAGEGSGAAILPELDQAIRDLEGAASAGARPVPPEDRKGILVLVIDDAGNNLGELEPFLAFPAPLTIAVLPGLPHSAEAARRVRAGGKEVFLHQPMEPLNGQDPGPGAIKTGMAAGEVKAALIKNLNEVGPVKGFNNHEGSRATMDPEIMKALLEVSRDRGLAFLDSRTIADTAGPAVAKELGLTIAQRDIFLDNEQDRESIIASLEAGCKKAEQNGAAILIGHTWSPRLAGILTEMYPQLVRRGYFFTTVSALLDPGK